MSKDTGAVMAKSHRTSNPKKNLQPEKNKQTQQLLSRVCTHLEQHGATSHHGKESSNLALEPVRRSGQTIVKTYAVTRSNFTHLADMSILATTQLR